MFMAGSHLIWRMGPGGSHAEPYAGSGAECLLDGPLNSASLAQPSGIMANGSSLFFIDSEASALRVIEGEIVTTLIGIGLFEFGDVDCPFSKAIQIWLI